ncbi:hypothetical protein Pint_32433 [Pistacia integerrima]|uniref:Uncharacterized protein n=1 Tax=Pistacia integerrima TaxID=434235 RepID=A0ACC0XQL9_9ROSI|nr:hypothetical protein Pint_32433 [Pistacia integerrima]
MGLNFRNDIWGSWGFSGLDKESEKSIDKESKDIFYQELGGAVDELHVPTFTTIIQDFETGYWRFMGVGNVNVNDGVVCNNEAEEVCFDCGGGGVPHDALFFVLGYLGVKDLLSVERVCRSLHDAVRSDPLLWRSIHIDQPLSSKISDDALAKLTGRTVGTLQCLSLVNYCRITDIGLKRVLESNPGLKKIRMETPSGIKDSIPACIKCFLQAPGEIPYNGIYYDPLEEVWFCNLLFL